MTKLDSLYRAEAERLYGIAENKDAPNADYLHPVFGTGNEHPVLMIVGEAPGKEEAESGMPFVGKAGKQLDAFLKGAGIERNAVFVTNAVKYRPVNRKERSVSNRTPSKAEILGSLQVLCREIELIDPKVIATFGNTPLFALKNIENEGIPDGKIGDLHGKRIDFYRNGRKMILFPMYHPASVIYNRTLKTVLEEDSRALAKLTLSLD